MTSLAEALSEWVGRQPAAATAAPCAADPLAAEVQNRWRKLGTDIDLDESAVILRALGV